MADIKKVEKKLISLFDENLFEVSREQKLELLGELFNIKRFPGEPDDILKKCILQEKKSLDEKIDNFAKKIWSNNVQR